MQNSNYKTCTTYFAGRVKPVHPSRTRFSNGLAYNMPQVSVTKSQIGFVVTSNSRPWRSIGSFMYICSAGPGPGGRTGGRTGGGGRTGARRTGGGGRTEDGRAGGRKGGRTGGQRRADGRADGGRTDGGWTDGLECKVCLRPEATISIYVHFDAYAILAFVSSKGILATYLIPGPSSWDPRVCLATAQEKMGAKPRALEGRSLT